MTKPITIAMLLSSAALASACSEDPMMHSAPVSLTLKAKSGDVKSGNLSLDKNVNTESGNPYAAFVKAATDALGGKAPSKLTLSRLTLTVAAESSGATTVGAIFAGACPARFIMNSDNKAYDAGTHTAVATDGAGPIEFTTSFTTASMSASEFSGFLDGAFKVDLSCPAATTFANANADVTLQTTLYFSAYE